MRAKRKLIVLTGSLFIGGCVSSRPAPFIHQPVAAVPPFAAAPRMPATAPAIDLHAVLLASATLEIQESPTLDAATKGYARGIALDPDSVALNLAYLRRTVDFESPETGFDAAQKILAQRPADATARAVAAFVQARQGQMNSALANIAIAVASSPADGFVQDTAGHLLAWYDQAAIAATVPPEVQASLRTVHLAMDNEMIFGAAYQDAALFYLGEQRRATRAAVPDAAVADAGPAGGTGPGPVEFAPTPSEADANADAPTAFEGIEPGLLGNGGFGGFFVVGDYFGGLGQRRPGNRRTHRHEPEATFRERFFGQGYRTIPVASAITGSHGVTAAAYLHQQFPASFPIVVGRNGPVVVAAGAQGLHVANSSSGGERLAGGSAFSTASRAPAGVMMGSPGFTSFNPVGIQAAGAANLRAPGINPLSFGAAGIPPGFIATPAPAQPTVQVSNGTVRSTGAPRGTAGGRTGSTGR